MKNISFTMRFFLKKIPLEKVVSEGFLLRVIFFFFKGEEVSFSVVEDDDLKLISVPYSGISHYMKAMLKKGERYFSVTKQSDGEMGSGTIRLIYNEYKNTFILDYFLDKGFVESGDFGCLKIEDIEFDFVDLCSYLDRYLVYAYASVGWVRPIVKWKKGFFGALVKYEKPFLSAFLDYFGTSRLLRQIDGFGLMPEITLSSDENLFGLMGEGAGVKGLFWLTMLGSDYVNKDFFDVAECKVLSELDSGFLFKFFDDPIIHRNDFSQLKKYIDLCGLLTSSFISIKDFPWAEDYLDIWHRDSNFDLDLLL